MGSEQPRSYSNMAEGSEKVDDCSNRNTRLLHLKDPRRCAPTIFTQIFFACEIKQGSAALGDDGEHNERAVEGNGHRTEHVLEALADLWIGLAERGIGAWTVQVLVNFPDRIGRQQRAQKNLVDAQAKPAQN